jgi:hypothetical protein
MTPQVNCHIASEAGFPSEITRRILKVVSRKKICHMDELLKSCKGFTWNQIFLEVDRLSRTRDLCLRYEQDGDYAISLPRAA